MQGTMLWFNRVNDVGVIATEDGERLAVLGSGFVEGDRPQGRCAGAAVTFRVVEDDDGRSATEVAFAPEAEQRRARLRHPRYRSHR